MIYSIVEHVLTFPLPLISFETLYTNPANFEVPHYKHSRNRLEKLYNNIDTTPNSPNIQ
jgi:hypothetical protein